MNPSQTLEKPKVSVEEDIDDPNEPEVIWDMEAIAQATADRKAGRIKTIPWEQVRAEIHAQD